MNEETRIGRISKSDIPIRNIAKWSHIGDFDLWIFMI